MAFIGHRRVNKPDGSTNEGWLSYQCGFCGRETAGAVIAFKDDGPRAYWLECTSCGEPTVRRLNGFQFPGITFGPTIEGLPKEVGDAYTEARRSMSVSAYTGAELICRKILMHIAVDKGASEGDTFANYLSFLEKAGYVTPPMKGWVDLIRKHGNIATHKMPPTDKERAEGTLMFTAELLRLVYEMEYMSKKYTPAATAAASSNP